MIEQGFFVGILMALARYSAFLFLLPLFTIRGVPWQLKAGIALLLSTSATPTVDFDLSGLLWLAVIVSEIGVGLVLAFVVQLVFGIIYFAGQLVDVPIGFGMVSIFDPQTGMQLPVFSQFYHLLSLLIFFSVDGHLWLFRALLESYQHIPVATFFQTSVAWQTILDLSRSLFSLGFTIALPIVGTIALTDVALGIVTRTVPQINVFVIGFPIKILVGMMMLTFVIPLFVATAASLFGYNGLLIRAVLSLIRQTGGSP